MPPSRFLDRPSELPWPLTVASLKATPMAPLPPIAVTRRMRQRLQDDPEMLRIAGRDGWGLKHDTIRWRLGLNERREFVFPVFLEGKLKQLVTRSADGMEPKYRCLAGHGAWWYPAPPEGRSVFLVAGMKDALIARDHRLNAVSTTCGTSLPRSFLVNLKHNVGERVDVLYDVGEEEIAEQNAERIRTTGLASTVIRLPLPERGADLVDFYRTGTPQLLRRLVREERGTAGARRG